jgi:glutamate-1-semialdehyde 2,1-aminomutase
MGDRLRNGLRKMLSQLGIRAQVVGVSSIFDLFFTQEKIRTVAQAKRSNTLLYRIFELGCLSKGISLGRNHCSFLSSPMTEKDIDQTLNAMREVLTTMVPTIKTIAPSLIEKD